MSEVLVYGFPSFTLGVPTAHYASCTINHAKIKIFGDYYIVIPICINYFKNLPITYSFLHPKTHSHPPPSTVQGAFVDSNTLQPPLVHVWGLFCGRDALAKAGSHGRLADKYLGVSGLRKPRAAKGEHAVCVKD